MSLQRTFESPSRDAQLRERADKRRVAREQLGFCFVCRIPIAWHFTDTRNRMLPCDHPDLIAIRDLLRRHGRAPVR